MDDLAVGGKSTSLIGTPGGTQQITVQHVRDEWRGVGSVPTPGVTTWVTTDVIPPARLQFRTRLPALNFQPGYPRRIFGAARPEFSGVHHLHFEGADRLSFQPGYF